MIANFNQQAYLRDWKRAHQSYERSQYPNFKSALDKQIAPVVDYINRHGIHGLQSKLTVLVSKQPMEEAYLRCYNRIGMQHASWVYTKIETIAGKKSYQISEQKDVPAFFSEHWRKLMSLFYHTEGAKRVTGVTETTRESVIQALDESLDLPISEQASYMVDKLGDPDFTRNRALVIARTESTTAAGCGALLGADSSDYETAKMWLSVLDANTRPTHVEANGEQVSLNDTFVVGDDLMQYPGDISASAKEVINCRCTVAIVPLVNENGVPVLK